MVAQNKRNQTKKQTGHLSETPGPQNQVQKKIRRGANKPTERQYDVDRQTFTRVTEKKNQKNLAKGRS